MCIPIAIDCGQPVLSPNVSVVSDNGTTEGGTVTLQCEHGLFPVIPITITCNSAGVWSTNPAEFVCTIFSGKSYSNPCPHSHNIYMPIMIETTPICLIKDMAQIHDGAILV